MSATFDFSKAGLRNLFHGTTASVEAISQGVRPGGYDGVFWTADASAIAQCYIPAAPGKVLVHPPSSYQLDQAVRPDRHSFWFGLAEQLGRAPVVEQWGDLGLARSWRTPPGVATYGELLDHVRSLGYQPSEFNGMFRIKRGGGPGGGLVMPADWKAPGALVIIDGFQSMRLADISRADGDLTDLQYHKVSLFRRLERDGYDGVVINDFCQSENRGNVGHLAYGFFAHAAARLELQVIPAVNFDWSDEVGGLQCMETPEFRRWRSAQVDAADQQDAELQIMADVHC